MLKKQVSPKIVAIVFAVIVVCFAIVVYVSAWTEPTAVPPGANVPAPLNTSLVAQTKQGNLVVNALGVNAAGNALLVPNGNVGIGTAAPLSKLHVYGNTGVDIRIEDAAVANAAWRILPQTGNITKLFRIYDATANLDRLVINASGNVGIGIAVPTAKLHIGGTAGVDGIRFPDGSLQKRAGRVVDVVNTQTGAVAMGITTIPFDDTIPQITEGAEFMTLTITPKSATNKLKIDVVIHLRESVGGNTVVTAALFRDAISNALAASCSQNATTYVEPTISFTHYMTAGTTNPITFRVRAGMNNAGTITFNGEAGMRRYGGVLASSITITEIE